MHIVSSWYLIKWPVIYSALRFDITLLSAMVFCRHWLYRVLIECVVAFLWSPDSPFSPVSPFWPLTSASHWVFSYSGTLLCTSVNATDSCITIKIPINQQFVKDSNTTPCSKSLQYPFFPILLLPLRFSESSSPHTHLNALIFNHVIGLLAVLTSNLAFHLSGRTA